MTEPHALSIIAAAEQLRTGRLSPVELVRSCLERIERLEPQLQAWATLDAEAALAAAEACHTAIRQGHYRGLLHGIPIGLKDIFFTAGVKTSMGSPIYADFVPDYDATSVSRLKEAGAIMLGKAHTTEFAVLTPAPTRNPWNPEHTPGGSSSGSAAAVVADMCPGALGSQTYGSTIRPAAYCGCVGLKPSYGRISAYGVHPVAWSLDHVGIFSRSVADAAVLLQTLAGDDPHDPACSSAAVPDYSQALTDPQAPRLGIIREFFLERAEPETRTHLESVAQRLARAGARIVEVSMPASFTGAPEAAFQMLYAEAAAAHREVYAEHKARYSPQMRDIIEKGRALSAVDYAETRRHQQRFRHDLNAVCQTVDAVLAPSTPAPAPHGLDSTGDPAFNGPASFSGLPSLGLPSGLSAAGLPFGIQLMAGAFAEDKLLGVGGWCEQVLGFDRRPPEA